MSIFENSLAWVYFEKTNAGVECYMSQSQLDKWINQNQGEYMDCVEGCLLDNYVIACKRGTAFVFEHYLNSNSSDYHVIWIKRGEYFTAAEIGLWNKFGKLYDEREALQNA